MNHILKCDDEQRVIRVSMVMSRQQCNDLKTTQYRLHIPQFACLAALTKNSLHYIIHKHNAKTIFIQSKLKKYAHAMLKILRKCHSGKREPNKQKILKLLQFL